MRQRSNIWSCSTETKASFIDCTNTVHLNPTLTWEARGAGDTVLMINGCLSNHKTVG